MNSNFAFQGNSIGCLGKVTKLKSRWRDSIPKTIFSRKILELETIDDIEELFNQHRATLPNHHYIVFQDKAFSIQIRPLGKPFKKREISKQYEFHTNHFIDDSIWKWAAEGKKDSDDRYEYLQDSLRNGLPTKQREQMIENIVKFLAKDKRWEKHTSATLLFTISKTKHACEGFFYFDNPNPSSVIVEID